MIARNRERSRLVSIANANHQLNLWRREVVTGRERRRAIIKVGDERSAADGARLQPDGSNMPSSCCVNEDGKRKSISRIIEIKHVNRTA